MFFSTSTRATPPGWPEGLPFRAWRVWVTRIVAVGAIGLGAFFGGVVYSRWSAPQQASPAAGGAVTAAPEVWTCSMHPQVRLPRAGQCPICFMDLVPAGVGAADDSTGPRVPLTETARRLARVETSTIEYRALTHEVRMVGKVVPDETRLTYVSSYVPGRLDRLFVNYTGVLVHEGDHLAEIYSPDLLVAQSEYLLARRSQEGAGDASGGGLLESARRKLEISGIPGDEIERLDRDRRPSDRLRIDAPREGWVLTRDAFAGMYVETGARLFTLADLRQVWVILEAYELDLAYLRFGQTVEFETEAYPGRAMTGRVAYIDPTLTELTRTVRVRVNVPNDNLQLRPGMFVRARLQVRIGVAGQVIENSLAGKWISPMHPEIIKDGPGACDVCGMDLVPAESLGFVSSSSAAALVLAVPRSAVLFTGKRALAYVERVEEGEHNYEGREIELGPRAGDYYVVLGGLGEGERIATRGALQIDSALQILARPSMMSASPPEATPQPTSGESRSEVSPSLAVSGAAYHETIAPALDAFLRLLDSCAADDERAAVVAAIAVRSALQAAAPRELPAAAAAAFESRLAEIDAALPSPAEVSISNLRRRLPALNSAFENYLRQFGHMREPIVRFYCPMAFDNRGAAWVQADDEIRNPYFGAAMLRCGERRGSISSSGAEGR